MFPPSLMDEAVIIWTELRVTSMNALFADNIFCSFGQLVSKFKIPQSLFFFRCLQLKYFVVSNIDCFPSCPSPSLLHKVFDLKPDAKWVTDVYELLSNHKLPTLQSEEQWGRDLGQQIADETWHRIINRIFFLSSICLEHVVIQFKVVHRLHWSKTRLSKIKDGIDPTCDRCKQEPASLFHMFWYCVLSFTVFRQKKYRRRDSCMNSHTQKSKDHH